jgi:hypothetical protein
MCMLRLVNQQSDYTQLLGNDGKLDIWVINRF